METISVPTPARGDRTMCFADPAKVCSTDGSTARVMTGTGIENVSLRLLEAAFGGSSA